MGVLVERDTETGATYYVLRDEPVFATRVIGDLIAIDLAADHEPVGVEFAADPREIGFDAWIQVFNAS